MNSVETKNTHNAANRCDRRESPAISPAHKMPSNCDSLLLRSTASASYRLTRHSVSSRVHRNFMKTLRVGTRHSTLKYADQDNTTGCFYPGLFSLLLFCAFAFAPLAHAQSSSPQTQNFQSGTEPLLSHRPAEKPAISETVALIVPKGTPVQVALDKEVRIKNVGQPLHARVVEPVYAFDRLVIPVGSEVSGQVTKVEPVSPLNRTLSALNADFTPVRKIDVEFTDLALPDGKHLPISTTVIPGSGQVIQFVSAQDANKKAGIKSEAETKTAQAKQQAKQEWDNALKQVEAPGKIHRLERYAVSLLPVHPQYVDAGTAYFAELQQPLEFGAEPLTAELASSIGNTPPEGSIVHARLVTPLSSALAQKGDDVEAVVSQPLFDGDKLVVPQGSFLKGSVVQVMSARRLSRNGQLRFVFHELVLPDGVDKKIDAVLSGVEAGKADNLKLDSEGGAQATTPKSRYLKTGIALGMAAVSMGGDEDAKVYNPAGNTSNRVVGGAGGFKLVGMVLGATVKSRAFGYSMGAYGAGMSVYDHFISRGREVVFPKDTAMDIGVATRPE